MLRRRVGRKRRLLFQLCEVGQLVNGDMYFNRANKSPFLMRLRLPIVKHRYENRTTQFRLLRLLRLLPPLLIGSTNIEATPDYTLDIQQRSLDYEICKLDNHALHQIRSSTMYTSGL